MSKINLFFVVIHFFICIDVLQAQMPISKVDQKELVYKKVIKYLKNISRSYIHFSDIQPSVNDSSDLSRFYLHSGTYIVNAPVQQTWDACIFTPPTELWHGKILELSCIYNGNSDRVFYRSDQQFDSLEHHQIYFINLRLIRLFNVAAALITTKIDADNNLIEFTYIKGNKSTGKQVIRLVGTGDAETKIIHDTYYQSKSKFRDKRLYSRFHQKAITELHQKIDFYSASRYF